jgi:molybdenum cofactor cytidylyltransferase
MAGSESTRWAAIVLAAGAGRRFGGHKLVATFEGRPLIAGALDAAFAAPVGRVILTTDGDLDLARIVVTTDAAEGMGASLRTAVAALPADTDGAFVFLGDMPRIPPGLAQTLAEAMRPGVELAAPRFEGRRGHPVLFGRACFPALLALTGDVGAREVLAEADERLVMVDSPDAGVLFDVDRREDLA